MNDYRTLSKALEERKPLYDKGLFQRMKSKVVKRKFTCLACGDKFVADMNEWDLCRMEKGCYVHLFKEKYGIVIDSIRRTDKCNVCVERS